MRIPVAMMFDDNYSIPCGVALFSLLTNADKNIFYDLYILHNNITEKHREKINKTISLFKNANLNFIDMHEKYKQFQNNISYPKELLYKLCLPSIFNNFDYIIVTDVDVVFTGDVSKEYIKFLNDNTNYFAGVKQAQRTTHKPFSTDITDSNMHFICGAGYMIYNLKKMREDNIEEKCLNFMQKYINFAKLPDQDILNQVCYPNIKLLHPMHMALTGWWVYKSEYIYNYSYNATQQELEEAIASPVQLHYVDSPNGEYTKPWLDPICPKAEEWYYYLSQTPFFKEQMINLINNSKLCKNKKNNNLKTRIFSVRNEYSKNNEKHKVITILGIKIKLKTAKTRTAVRERERERERE